MTESQDEMSLSPLLRLALFFLPDGNRSNKAATTLWYHTSISYLVIVVGRKKRVAHTIAAIQTTYSRLWVWTLLLLPIIIFNLFESDSFSLTQRKKKQWSSIELLVKNRRKCVYRKGRPSSKTQKAYSKLGSMESFGGSHYIIHSLTLPCLLSSFLFCSS